MESSFVETIESRNLWYGNTWNNISLVCQQGTYHRIGHNGILSNPNNYSSIYNSMEALCLFQFTLILLVILAASFLLKPFGLPIISQMAGGIIVMGLLFPNKGPSRYKLLPEPVLYILKTLSYVGFSLHLFVLGVETNMGALRRIGKKSITISFCGIASSIVMSFFIYNLLERFVPEYLHNGSIRLIVLQAQNFFGVTCTNVNNLRVANSELGRLASDIALIVDFFTIFSSFFLFDVILALENDDLWKPVLVLGENVVLFFVLRPILLFILSYTPQGCRMRHSHFIVVLCIVLIATFLGSLVDQYFSVYLMALSLPEEPLSSILAEKLDSITSGFYFPVFCAIHGFQANFGYLKDYGTSVTIEVILMTGHFGKFIGTLVSSRLFALPWNTAVSLAIILTSKGFIDLMLTCQWSEKGEISVHEYTLSALHILITTFIFLPLVRKLYEPSTHYSTVFRHDVASSSQCGTLQTLACIYNEENVPGIIHLLEALHPSRSNRIPVVTIQLIQLTGRCSLPIIGPWDHVKFYAALRSNISCGTRIVNTFSNLERKFKGYIHMQHYVSVSPYATMYNDICNLAYEKNVSLLILPFSPHGTIEDRHDHSFQSIREVNKMVFQKAPCSVAAFINRRDRDLIQLQLNLPNYDMYKVTVFFIGGPDDREALAFSRFFASHPFTTLTLIRLNSEESKVDKNSKDNYAIERTLMENESLLEFKEVDCKDGAETTEVLMAVKDEIDLAVVGMHHDSKCGPLFGLDGEWKEYSEFGVLADFLLSSDFNFSVLVVQKEPQQDLYVCDG